jgi:hydroxyacylglutathione hydrolase
VEPDNAQLKARLAWAESRRAAGEPTVPSSIADEKATNPFVRVNEKTVQDYAGMRVYSHKVL